MFQMTWLTSVPKRSVLYAQTTVIVSSTALGRRTAREYTAVTAYKLIDGDVVLCARYTYT